MSVSSQPVKEELSRFKASRRCCQLAELSALLHMDGTYKISGGGGHSLVVESPSAHISRKIYELIHALFSVETPISTVKRSVPRRGSVYRIEIPEQSGFHQLLNELGVLDSSLSPEPSVPERFVRNDCCVSAALRGAFIGGGFISEPFGPADFEITFSSAEAAAGFQEMFRRKELEPRVRRRRNQWVLYLKQRKQISHFLAVTGAHSAYLEWMDQAILRNTKNTVNRLVNCDSANAKRIVEASIRQRDVITRLKNRGLLDGLPPELVELAKARLANPQASLSELGRILVPPVTKAVVQGRMRRLEAALESAGS